MWLIKVDVDSAVAGTVSLLLQACNRQYLISLYAFGATASVELTNAWLNFSTVIVKKILFEESDEEVRWRTMWLRDFLLTNNHRLFIHSDLNDSGTQFIGDTKRYMELCATEIVGARTQ